MQDKLVNKWNLKLQEFRVSGQLTTSCKEASIAGQLYYEGNCGRHGPMLFYTKDNSCPLCCREARQRRNQNNGTFNRTRELFNEIVSRAKKAGLDFDLTLDGLRKLITEAKVCPVFGTPLVICAKGQERTEDNTSVDRFDSNKGYTFDNVRIISSRANRIKNNGTALEHIQVALYMTNDPEKRALLQTLIDMHNR